MDTEAARTITLLLQVMVRRGALAGIEEAYITKEEVQRCDPHASIYITPDAILGGFHIAVLPAEQPA